MFAGAFNHGDALDGVYLYESEVGPLLRVQGLDSESSHEKDMDTRPHQMCHLKWHTMVRDPMRNSCTPVHMR